MYDFITGDLIEVSPVHAVIHAYNIGYHINITLGTYAEIEGHRFATLFIHQHIREDINALYGFQTKEERVFFRHLISVSGIGPASALKALASAPWKELAQIIVNGDLAAFKKVKGIGPKTANQITIELRDKIELEPQEISTAPTFDKITIEDATKALAALGFPKGKAKVLCEEAFKKEPSLSVEGLIKAAMKKM